MRPRNPSDSPCIVSGVQLIFCFAGFAPTANSDSYNVFYDTLDTAPDGQPRVLSNDYDPDGSWPLTAVLVSNPSHGCLTFNSNGHFLYSPDPNYTGSDSLTYQHADQRPGHADVGWHARHLRVLQRPHQPG